MKEIIELYHMKDLPALVRARRGLKSLLSNHDKKINEYLDTVNNATELTDDYHTMYGDYCDVQYKLRFCEYYLEELNGM